MDELSLPTTEPSAIQALSLELKFPRRVFNKCMAMVSRFAFSGSNSLALPRIADSPLPSPVEYAAVKAGLNETMQTVLLLFGKTYVDERGSIFESISLYQPETGKNAADIWKNDIAPRFNLLENSLLEIAANQPLQKFLRQRDILKSQRYLLDTKGILKFTEEVNLEEVFKAKSNSLPEETRNAIDKIFFSQLPKMKKAVFAGTATKTDAEAGGHLRSITRILGLPPEKQFLSSWSHYPDLKNSDYITRVTEFEKLFDLDIYASCRVDMFDQIIRYVPGKGYQHLIEMDIDELRATVKKGFLKVFTKHDLLKPAEAEEIERFEKVAQNARKKAQKGPDYAETHKRREQLMQVLEPSLDLAEARNHAKSQTPQK